MTGFQTVYNVKNSCSRIYTYNSKFGEQHSHPQMNVKTLSYLDLLLCITSDLHKFKKFSVTNTNWDSTMRDNWDRDKQPPYKRTKCKTQSRWNCVDRFKIAFISSGPTFVSVFFNNHAITVWWSHHCPESQNQNIVHVRSLLSRAEDNPNKTERKKITDPDWDRN